jgi:hypothetical protein
MRILVALTAAGAALLTAGCGTQQSTPRPVSAGQPGTAGAVSNAPASNSPVLSAQSTSAHPTLTRPARADQASSPSMAPATSSATVTAPHTQLVIRRPVTGTGRAAPGYTVVALPADDYQIACGGLHAGDSPSPSAVDDGIASCGPSAAYALACWKGPTATIALCYRNPWQRQVDLIKASRPLGAQHAPQQPTPLGLVLSDGTRCWLRDGGAWSQLDGHPELFGSYSCGHNVVWAPARSDGIDRTHAMWSVRVAPMSGHGRLRTVSVRTAYFVGTSRS